jgi:hypothetical protein
MSFQIPIISKVPVKPALIVKNNFNTSHVLIARKVAFGKTLITFKELEQHAGRVKNNISMSIVFTVKQ